MCISRPESIREISESTTWAITHVIEDTIGGKNDRWRGTDGSYPLPLGMLGLKYDPQHTKRTES